MDSKTTKEKNSHIFQIKSLISPKGCFFKVQFMLRALAFALAFASMATILSSTQSITIFGIVIRASYSYSSTFIFIFIGDIIVCVCSILSLILVFLLSRSNSNIPGRYFVAFLHDLVMALLMMGVCAAATAIGDVGRDGINQFGWVPICNFVERFCDKARLAVAFSCLVVICYLVLTVMPAHKLKSWAQQGI